MGVKRLHHIRREARECSAIQKLMRGSQDKPVITPHEGGVSAVWPRGCRRQLDRRLRVQGTLRDHGQLRTPTSRTARRLCAYMGRRSADSEASYRTAGRDIAFVCLGAGVGRRQYGRGQA